MSAPPRILLTGANGQVGHALAQQLSQAHLLTPTRAELDLADPDAISRYVDQVRPDLIINPAAYTAVDKAESEPQAAAAINTIAPGILAAAAQRHGIALIHFSTDYVFDGSQDEPYHETDATAPASVYGRTKHDGELAVLQACEAAWVLRTSWVYGSHGGNFMKTILRLAQEREQLSIVADQWGAPTWSRTIAEVVTRMLGDLAQADALTARVRQTRGLYHLTASGHTNWHQYACRIVEAMPSLGLTPRIAAAAIAAIPSEAYPTPARRPRNSRLCTDKLAKTFGVTLPQWDSALAQCLQEMRTGRD